jgi:CheY-like chemotaxis protein
VPKTLLAVDDSATMRKVLEITFAGEDLRVVAADTPASALAKMNEEPVAAVIDTSLEGGDGYALAKEIRARDPRVAIVIMASRYSPYDAGRGRDAGVDDFIDKPFDTQAFIDKVKKAVVAREAIKIPAAVAPVVPAAAPAVNPVVPPFAATPRPAITGATGTRPVFPTQRTHTLSFEGSPIPPGASPQVQVPTVSRTAPSGIPVFQQGPPPMPAPAAAPAPVPAHAPAPVHAHAPAPAPAHAPAPAPAIAAASPPARPAPPVIATVPAAAPAAHQAPTAPPRPLDTTPMIASANGHLAGKLGDLGLSPVQVEAVLALSREVVERVVWEVVPQLAETIIKEELARLTKED